MTTTQLDEFEKLLEESFNSKLSVADVVRGLILKKENDGFLVDIGAKSEGFLPNKEVPSSMLDELKIGDCKEFYILKEDDDDNNGMLLSLKRVACAQAWQNLQNAKISGETVIAKVVSLVKGGVIVEVEDLRGFIPASQLRTGMPFDGLMNQEIEVKVLKIDEDLKRISLSLKRIGDNPWEEIEDKFEEGQVITGTVNKVTSFGAFINIFPGVEALLPVAEMEDSNANPFDVYKNGDEVKVLIKKFTPQEHRIALSVKDIKE